MILLVESIHRDISWKEPKDLTYEEAASGVNRKQGSSICSFHTVGDDFFHHALRGAHVAFADGTVHFLSEDISPEDLQALLTGDPSRPVNLESLERPSLNWTNIFSLTVLIVSSVLLIANTRMHQRKQAKEKERMPPIKDNQDVGR